MNQVPTNTAKLNWLRFLNKILPLNQRFYPLIKNSCGECECVSVPTLGLNLVLPTQSIKGRMDVFLGGIYAAVPDFHIIKKEIANLTSGCILDVGANCGCWTMACSRVTSLPIIGFEPEPALFNLFQKNMRINAINTADALNCACGAEDCLIDFHLGENGYTLLPGHHKFSESDPEVIRVECKRLDTLFADRKVAFIKIDVEGFEWHVLQGAAGIIRQQKPVLFVEIHPPQLIHRGQTAEAVLQLLKINYRQITIHIPRPRSRQKVINFINNYRGESIHQEVSERDFYRLVQSKNPPLQIYAVCNDRLAA
jgi:FkbM family methyltransferase